MPPASQIRWRSIYALHMRTRPAAAVEAAAFRSPSILANSVTLTLQPGAHQIRRPKYLGQTRHCMFFWENLEKHQSPPQNTEKKLLTPHQPSTRSKTTRKMFPRSRPEISKYKRRAVQSPHSRAIKMQLTTAQPGRVTPISMSGRHHHLSYSHET
jgi:hypothetical protein